MRSLLIIPLLLASCTTQTQTQHALIHDARGVAVSRANVEIYGDPPEFWPGLMGRTVYMRTTTDARGWCILTYPTKKTWDVDVDQEASRQSFISTQKTYSPGHLDIVVKARSLVTYPPST